MTTKVLNKIVNVCTTLSGGDSSGTSSSSSTSTSDIIDQIFPVGSLYISLDYVFPTFGGEWGFVFQTSLEHSGESLTTKTYTIYVFQRTG